METLKDILWPVVLVGGLGAFIDFLIGKAGQERAKDFLLRWWVRFEDAHWKNIGREEGLFAGHLIGRWLGQRIWSLRRIPVALVVFCVSYLIGYIIKYSHLSPLTKNGLFVRDVWCSFCHVGLLNGTVTLGVLYFGFTAGVSFTKIITFVIAYLSGIRRLQNLIMFTTMLVINYVFLLLWFPVMDQIKADIMLLVPDIMRGADFPGLLYLVNIFVSVIMT